MKSLEFLFEYGTIKEIFKYKSAYKDLPQLREEYAKLVFYDQDGKGEFPLSIYDDSKDLCDIYLDKQFKKFKLEGRIIATKNEGILLTFLFNHCVWMPELG